MIRILLADDQTLLRQGLSIILTAEEDLTVVGEAANGREAVDLARELTPDVVLIPSKCPSWMESRHAPAFMTFCPGAA